MRLKAKQNDEPNVQNKCKKDGVKTRNQVKNVGNARKLSVQTSDEISIKKSKSVQNIERNHQKNKQKQFCPIQKLAIIKPNRKPHDPAEDYYDEILNHTYRMNQNKQKFQRKLAFHAGYLKIRHVLIQSMYKNYCRFNLRRKTMFLFVRFLDTFVLKNGYQTDNILPQCYACFLMALKYQEIYPPSLSEWSPQNMQKKIYQEQGKVLKVLNFNLVYDSVQYYFQYYSQEVYKKQFTTKIKEKCQLILDLLLFLPHMIQFHKAQKLAHIITVMGLGLNDNDQNINLNQKQSKYKQLEDVKKAVSKQIFQNYHRLHWIAEQKTLQKK